MCHSLCGPHQVLVTDPKELELIRQRELDITRERIQKIIDAGAGAGLGGAVGSGSFVEQLRQPLGWHYGRVADSADLRDMWPPLG